MLRHFRAPLVLAFAFALSACGGGGSGAAPRTAPSQPATSGTGTARFTLSFPLPGSASPSSHRRKSSYISAKTQSVGVFVTSVNGAPPSPPVPAVTVDVHAGATGCTATGGTLTCTLSISVPSGSIGVSVRTYAQPAAAGRPLSVGDGIVTVVAGQSVDAQINLLGVVALVVMSRQPGSLPINAPGTAVVSFDGRDVDGDTIAGPDKYYAPITVTTNDTNGHVTSVPALPATITGPGQTLTLSYDGKGTAPTFSYTAAVAPTAVVDGVPPVTGALPFGGSGQHLYAVAQSTNAVFVYDAGGAGASSIPVRTITGPATTIAQPVQVAVDSLGAVYVVNYHRDVTVYAPGADGNAVPFKTFAGGAGHPESIEITAGYISTTGPSNVSDPTTNNVQLYALLDNTTGVGGDFIRSIAQNFVVSWATSPVVPLACAIVNPGSLSAPFGVCYQSPAPGSGNYTTVIHNSYAAKFRPDGSYVMTSPAGLNSPAAVYTYNLPLSSSQSIIAPTAVSTISGDATGLSNPYQLAFDAAGNTYVANAGQASGDGRITVYAPNANGNVAPIRTIGGFTTLTGVAVGP